MSGCVSNPAGRCALFLLGPAQRCSGQRDKRKGEVARRPHGTSAHDARSYGRDVDARSFTEDFDAARVPSHDIFSHAGVREGESKRSQNFSSTRDGGIMIVPILFRGKKLALPAVAAGILVLLALPPVAAQAPPPPPKGPWMDKALSPDRRADLVMEQMTLDEKLTLVHGTGGFAQSGARSNGGAGVIEGIPRLGLPDLQLADSAVGVRAAAERGRYATLLPSTVAEAATWDVKLAFAYGELIGRELRDQQYNVSLGGGVNITREPRNGRNFEYLGEDPILAGKMVGAVCQGAAEQQRDRRREALRVQRSGDRPQYRQRQARQTHRPRDGSAGVRDRRHRRAAWHGDVLLQQVQRRLGVREQLPADRRAQEGLGLQGLRHVGLGRHPQHREGRAGGHGQRGAGQPLLRRCAEEGGGERRGADGAAQ